MAISIYANIKIMPQRLDISARGFKKSECHRIKAPTLQGAFIQFGKFHKKEILKQLEDSLYQFSQNDQIDLITKAKRYHAQLNKLSAQGLFTVGKTNYLERYLTALRSYADGAGITIEEAIYLQLDIFPGCQTLLISDLDARVVRFLHTEENSSDEDFYKGKYNYRLVEMQFAGTHITFFAYPGLCGWGPAFCINHTGAMAQVVDDLYATPSPTDGPLWVNAFVFMTADAGDINTTRTLIERTAKYNGHLFINGHAVHQVYADNGQTLSFECLRRRAEITSPVRFNSKLVTAQSNIPRHPKLLPFSDSYLPPNHSKWSQTRVLLYEEMVRRAKRLEIYGKHLNLVGKNCTQSLNLLEQFISSSLGDLEIEKLTKTKYHYVQTGVSSSWTVATMIGYMSSAKSQLRIIKGVPETLHTAALLQDLMKDDLMAKDIYALSTKVINGTKI